jgi:hypothetical protein
MFATKQLVNKSLNQLGTAINSGVLAPCGVELLRMYKV